MPAYLDIKSVSGSDSRLIKQDLKFRTGKFVWKVIFNIPLNPATVTEQNLQVLNPQKQVVETRISYNPDMHAIEIEPREPYSSGQTYTLHVTQRVESKGGQRLKNDIDIEFEV